MFWCCFVWFDFPPPQNYQGLYDIRLLLLMLLLLLFPPYLLFCIDPMSGRFFVVFGISNLHWFVSGERHIHLSSCWSRDCSWCFLLSFWSFQLWGSAILSWGPELDHVHVLCLFMEGDGSYMAPNLDDSGELLLFLCLLSTALLFSLSI